MNATTPDVGTVGITSSGVIGAATTASTLVGWVNENALIIGITLSLLSLLVGVFFKILANKRIERHHKERMIADAKQSAKALETLRAEILKSRD